MSVISIKQPAVSASAQGKVGTQPFADSRDHSLYYPAPAHEAIVAQLQEALSSGQASFAAVTGSSGSGKTFLRTVLHSRLDPARFVRVSIESSLLDFDSLLLELISQMSGRRALASDWPDRYSRLSEFKRLLSQQIVRPDRHLAVMVDEAQGMDAGTLEGLRLLSNISTAQRTIMTFVLFGTAALEPALRGLPELWRRVGRTLALEPLDVEATRAYVKHQAAGAGPEAFLELSDSAFARLHRMSHGLPGQINRIMRAASQVANRRGCGITDEVLLGLPASAIPFDPAVGLEGCEEWIR
jgi:general secretion pathway protein A